MSLQRSLRLLRRQQIQLVQHQPALFLAEIGAELLQLADDRARILHRIRIRVRRRDIDQVQQHARALQVLEEADAEARALRRAFDEPGNVRHHEAAMRRRPRPRPGSDAAS